jgi:hypothetical protein
VPKITPLSALIKELTDQWSETAYERHKISGEMRKKTERIVDSLHDLPIFAALNSSL